jgi:hypothetical protein
MPSTIPNPALLAALKAQEAMKPQLSPGPQPVTSGPGHSPPSEALTASLAAREAQSGAMGAGYVGEVPEAKPLVSGALAAVAGLVATLGAIAAPLIPAPWGGLVGAAALVAGLLAGIPLATPKWAEGKPLVPVTLVPTLATAGAGLASLVPSLPVGYLQSGGLALAALLLALAGKALPTPRA